MAGRPSRHFKIEPLAPGVHAAIAAPEGFGLCNSGIVNLGDETLVFDTMLTPVAGHDLVRAAERITGHRPTWVVNSHWHGDHIWGNSAFVESHIVSSRTVRENILKFSRAQFRDDRRFMRRELPSIDGPDSSIVPVDRPLLRAWYRGLLATPASHRIVPPSVTFEDRIIIEGSRRAVHLITYGGGHSPSDVFAYLPGERILFGGDLAIRGFHPSLTNGRPRVWIEMLKRMERLGSELVLPGHGPPGPPTILSETRTYLGDVDRLARKAIRDRTSPRELATTPAPDRYRRWKFAFMWPGNLSHTYRLARAEARKR